MANVHAIDTYNASFSDRFFVDNNVWMFLFCPIGNYEKKKQEKYSSFIANLISNKRTIFVNSLVLSEFSNAYLRIDFNIWKRKPENAGKVEYKRNFVGTDHFNKTIEEVKNSIKKILSFSERGNDEFNSVLLDNIFRELGPCDFNDSYYIELGRLKKYKIVTDDSDFFIKSKAGIDVITANI